LLASDEEFDGSPVYTEAYVVTQPDILPDDVDSAPVPYFVRDGNRYLPTGFARGGWGPSISGHVVGGLLGWAVERAVDDPGLQPARLSVDLPAPTALEPVDVHINVRHDRRRLRLVEAVLTQRGEPVARATALFLRRGPQPDGNVWSQPVQMPPVPTELDGAAPTLFLRTYGWGGELQNPDPEWGTSGPKYTWLHETRPLIDDEPLTAFTRTAMCADVTAAIANWGTEALQFINVDYTLTLSRLPEGPHIGLAALSHYSHDGIANGSAVVLDHKGPVGSAVAVSIAHSGFHPPPIPPAG
jgi:Thioesterase-like superfamily